jgi:hypothetical protein
MLTIELEPELEMRLKAVAEKEHCSVNEMAKRFISVCLKEKQQTELKESAQTEGQRILQVLDEYNLLGCMEGGDGTLSVNYKKHLWGNE